MFDMKCCIVVDSHDNSFYTTHCSNNDPLPWAMLYFAVLTGFFSAQSVAATTVVVAVQVVAVRLVFHSTGLSRGRLGFRHSFSPINFLYTNSCTYCVNAVFFLVYTM